MGYKVGDTFYLGNSVPFFREGVNIKCIFAKCKVLKVYKEDISFYYECDIITNYGCIGKEINNPINVSHQQASISFEEAKNRLYKSMNISSDNDFIKIYFERAK